MNKKQLKNIPIFIAILLLSAVVFAQNVSETSHITPNKKKVLEEVLQQVAQELYIPGAIVFLKSPVQSMTISYGTTQLSQSHSPDAKTHFRIGSNTKSMISAVIIQMAQEGKLNLEDPVAKYVSSVPNGDKISLELLMKNRSGLVNYLDSPKIAHDFDENPAKVWTPEELLSLSFKRPVLFPPNEQFDYSNTNFILLGLIAEKLDKKPLATILQDRLFIPLGMKHTFLPNTSDITLPKPYSHGYSYGKSAHVFTHAPYSAEMKKEVQLGKVMPIDYTNQSASWAWAAGGVVSTLDDLSIWIESLATGKLFNQTYYQKWKNSPVPSDATNPNVKYGYGFMSIETDLGLLYFHSGELPGFNSYMIYDPKRQLTLTMWSNLTVSIDTVPTAGIIKSAIFKALY